MFGRKHHQGRKSTNIVFVMFRLMLSLTMFVILLFGIYSAYKHFSGLDPLKLDPQAIASELLAGKVPQQFTDILSSTKITKKVSDQINQKVLGGQKSKEIPSEDAKNGTDSAEESSSSDLAFRFLLVADSHSDNANLNKAIIQAKANYPDLKFIIGLGDYTQVGTIAELKNVKKEFDASSLRYFLIPGDHDLWDCRNRKVRAISCFEQVFGPSYQTFTFNNFKFLLLDNSDDYLGVGETESKWIESELGKSKEEGDKGILVFLHEPLFHPSSDHVMGKVEKGLKQQARDLMFQFKDAGVKRVFAGDTHLSSEYNESVTGLSMATIGAVSIERNPQAPRFAVVSVFGDGSTKVEDVEIR